jgi:predicted metal-dependent hydrolase
MAEAGLRLFNQGHYFEAHEALETAWRDEKSPLRGLYQGILQVGVGYHHLLRGNHSGAIRLLDRAEKCLAPFPDQCSGIDLGQLRQDFFFVRAELIRLGPQRLHLFNRELLKPLIYQGS